MLIRQNRWDEVRTQFSEPEKAHLRKVIQGEAICPPGWVIDEDKLPADLRQKLQAAVKGK